MVDNAINKVMSEEEKDQVEEKLREFEASFLTAFPSSSLQNFEKAILRTFILWSIRHG